jgi:hypothetical protein
MSVTTFEPTPPDRGFWEAAHMVRLSMAQDGASLALALADQHLGVIPRVDGPIYLIADAQRKVLALGTSDDLRAAFGTQIWIAFERATRVDDQRGYDGRPILSGVDLCGRLEGVTDPIYGAQICQVIDWIE